MVRRAFCQSVPRAQGVTVVESCGPAELGRQFFLLFLMPGRSALERRGQCAGSGHRNMKDAAVKKDNGKTTGDYKKNVRVTKCTKISKELMASI